MRIDLIIPKSKAAFISKHAEMLKLMQNLPEFSSWLTILTAQASLSTSTDDSNSLNAPLLNNSRASNRQSLTTLVEIAKGEYIKHENIDLFPKEPDYPDFMTLILTVLSSFIHLTNFYILGLAAKDYSVHVGMTESFSGVLSGVNWTSAVVFTFAYSYWSNYQFKIPTVVCALFVVFGNLIYFFAYSSKSAAMLTFGRFLIGIGGARVINRRYIATYVAPKARTFWNSAYVACSIIGRGVGPIAAAGLFFLDINIFGLEINGMNSPALLMAIIWFIYFILIFYYFQEPKILQISQAKIEESRGQSLIPTYVVIFALIVPKIVHEAYVTSIPIVAQDEFDWSIDFIGVYIAAVSLAVAPVHIFIAFTSKIFQDRQFIKTALILTAVGCAFLINFDDLSEVQYIIGSIIMYLGVNMDDGVTASLLSKVIPLHFSAGILNVGLIVTFAGSLARGIGGFSIAIAGFIEDDADEMENMLFVPMTLLSISACVIIVAFYRFLSAEHK